MGRSLTGSPFELPTAKRGTGTSALPSNGCPGGHRETSATPGGTRRRPGAWLLRRAASRFPAPAGHHLPSGTAGGRSLSSGRVVDRSWSLGSPPSPFAGTVGRHLRAGPSGPDIRVSDRSTRPLSTRTGRSAAREEHLADLLSHLPVRYSRRRNARQRSASIVNRMRGRTPRQVCTSSVGPRLVSPAFSNTRMEARFSGSAVAHILALTN